MENTTFRYRGMDFPYSPRSVQIQRERKLVRLLSPVSGAVVQDMGFLPAVVTGEGELFGPLAEQEFQKMKQLFDSDGCGLLQIPGQPAMSAFFAELSLARNAGPDVLRYRFTFVESGGSV